MNLAACLLEVVEEVKNMGQENKSFPSNKFEALALLYVENLKNISAFSPEGLLKSTIMLTIDFARLMLKTNQIQWGTFSRKLAF